jgi:hypothetical protein
MPARGHATAPKFDPKQPRELRRYFDDLELLFANCNITNEADMKKHARRYLDIDSSDLWEILPECDAIYSFEDFAKAVYKLYPGSEDDYRWSIADMEGLIAAQHCTGIADTNTLGIYYRHFRTITQFLLSKNRLSEAEQSRAFARGFPTDLWQHIACRLELKFPDHYPDDPYPLEDVHDAAKFVLHGTSPASFQSDNTATMSPTPAVSEIRSEDLAMFLEKFSQTLITALAPRTSSQPYPLASQPAPMSHSSPLPPADSNKQVVTPRTMLMLDVSPVAAFTQDNRHFADHADYPDPSHTLLNASDRIAALEQEIYELRSQHVLESEPLIHQLSKSDEPSYLSQVFAAPQRPSKACEHAYQVQASIKNPKIACEVFPRTSHTQDSTLSPEDFASLSPELRDEVTEAITSKTMPISQTNFDFITDNDPLPFAEYFPDPEPISSPASPPIIIPDPYEAYLSSLRSDQTPEVLIIAKESHALRSVSILIDNRENIEATLEPGSKIIAMSEDLCHKLELPYDPTIRLDMQSEDGIINRTLGLARNVPCRIGDVTLYLQFHVIREPAYAILLGHPFDVLTNSTVKNFANANQRIEDSGRPPERF